MDIATIPLFLVLFLLNFSGMVIRLSLFSCFLLFFIACSTNFDLEGEWKDIPVVYAILSRQDTAHYIRVEKAFLPSGTNAADIARIADSLYYSDDMVVQLERVVSGERFTLNRVDGNQEGYPREEGPFAQSPNILYKLPAKEIQLQEGERIRLWIERGEGNLSVTAETTILEDIIPRQNNPVSPVNWGYDRNVTFSWQTGPATRLFDLRIVIRYQESDPANPSQWVDKSLVWVLKEELELSGSPDRGTFNVRGEDFYLFLKENIDAEVNRLRRLQGMDLYITGAGEELQEYLRIARANRGITSAQAVPVYTNLSEGRGIFTSRSTGIRPDLQLNALSLDSLRNGIHTAKLNFVQ